MVHAEAKFLVRFFGGLCSRQLHRRIPEACFIASTWFIRSYPQKLPKLILGQIQFLVFSGVGVNLVRDVAKWSCNDVADASALASTLHACGHCMRDALETSLWQDHLCSAFAVATHLFGCLSPRASALELTLQKW